ncbi:MAG: S9 family peptidase [Gemmataceae bacterium]|nr:S9 family peptidase [Gemmataceae bacterium]
MRKTLVMAAFAVCWLASTATAQDVKFTPHHVSRIKSVTQVAISPDGEQIAYVLSVPRNLPKEKDGANWAELHVVDRKGGKRPFITGQTNVDSLSWSPDSKTICFLSKRDKDEHRSLYAISIRGGEARKVFSHGADLHSYSWSSDGKKLAFLAEEPPPKDRKTRQDQGFTQEVYEEDVHPIRAWTVEPESGESAKKLDLKGSASELHYRPKHDDFAVALAPTPLIDDHLMFRKVHIVTKGGGTPINLKNPGKMDQLAWSPDGKRLALITGQDKHDPSAGRLWVVEDPEQGWLDVAPQFKGHVDSIAWKDADHLLYQTSEGVFTNLYTAKLHKNDGKLSVGDVRNISGNVILGKISCDAAGKYVAAIGHLPQHPPEVYLIDLAEGSILRHTDHNPWLLKMALGKQEVIRHKAKDGLELEGILIRPLNEKKGERYPLVLNVHGGPESHVSNGWNTAYHTLGQVAAAKNIAFFLPNYRGSTGRGVEFSMLGQKAAAGKEFEDLIDAVDHLVGMGLVDSKKVGITGGSYGGYATAWGSTYYSDRFAAGVMFVGISNSLSKVGTTDIPQEMFLVHHRQWLWDDWDYFIKSSPIKYVEKAKTPLLIMHGKNDPRVHPSQSLELYRHLKVRNQAPVRLVLYPGEGHGNRRAASKIDYNLRLLQWMEHYLQGPGGEPPPYTIDPTPALSGTASLSWNRDVPQTASGSSDRWLGRGCPCCLEP